MCCFRALNWCLRVRTEYRPYEPDKAHYDRTYLETAIYTIIGKWTRGPDLLKPPSV